ncbi:type II toxin-antitoxin system RelE/ParE family toxin [Neogemmobacter tilapiae]|uniref:Type II toxin-antitoxin system RelE/ParE family toxin n=1 Tax=Neogemmobacter tilapiae TaxID=875041 RepID=A0A918TI72_9RHOB|nr:type II toxin-antitoxin system RelE/ParE family toxin [Gemmobacter tilapiae]GHC48914.1 hypothetical protein GCM10007315_08750 [Gemmobacter tilapiae]
MPDIGYSSRALASMDSFSSYFRARNPEVAEALLSEIESLCILLLDFPELGRKIPGTSLRYAVTRKYRYRVVYRMDNLQLSVVDILHPKAR